MSFCENFERSLKIMGGITSKFIEHILYRPVRKFAVQNFSDIFQPFANPGSQGVFFIAHVVYVAFDCKGNELVAAEKKEGA